MKKAGYALIIITVAICILACGILIGRNLNRSSITLVSTTGTSPDSTSQETTSKKININAASVEELTLLPGIGNTLAQRIVNYRTDFGPFRSKTDLCNVEGIGEKKLLKLLDYITI